MTRFDTSLADLPALTGLNRPRTWAELCQRLDERHGAALRIAKNTLAMADRLLAYDDLVAAFELFAEASAYIDEAERIAELWTAKAAR